MVSKKNCTNRKSNLKYLIFLISFFVLNITTVYSQISHEEIVEKISKKINVLKFQIEELKNVSSTNKENVDLDSIGASLTSRISKLDDEVNKIMDWNSIHHGSNTQILKKISNLEKLFIEKNQPQGKNEKKNNKTIPSPTKKETKTSKISGKVFSDLYWIAGSHEKSKKDQHGFWFRRIYLTFDQSIEKNFSARLRFEMSQPGDFPDKGEKMSPVVKDAYLKWKNNYTNIYLGLSSTPTWKNVEKYWGYRSVEKTPLDLQKLGSSRDLGISIKGQLDTDGQVKYNLMYGNGSSNKSETNKGKSWFASFSYSPIKELFFEVYGDYRDQSRDNDISTAQIFAAYKTSSFRIGIQFVHQTHENGKVESTEIVSLFAVSKVVQNLSVFARVDRMFDPNPSGYKISYIPFDPSAKSTFIVSGIDYKLMRNVSLIPNIEIALYDKNKTNIKPKTDVIPRITFYYKF